MFIRRLRLGKRLILAFLCMASLVAVVGFFSLAELQRVVVPLTDEVPAQLEQIRVTADADDLIQKIIRYNQVMTESVRNYSQQNNREYKLKYKEFESRLDASIRELGLKGKTLLEQIFPVLDKQRRVFVSIEQRAVYLTDMGRSDEAVHALESEEYWNAKRLFRQQLDQYIDRRGDEYDQSLAMTVTKIEAMLERIHEIVERSQHVLFLLILIAVFIALFLGVYVSRTIITPIRSLQKGAKLIGKGVLDHRIDVESEDEIGELAELFNAMTVKLHDFYSGLEAKVQEKTKELASKMEQIQHQNEELENTQEAMLNVLEDLESAKAVVEEEKAKDEAILASVGDGLIATDRNGNIMMMNHQAEQILGLKAEECLRRPYRSVVEAFDQDGTLLDAVKQPLYRSLACAKRITSTAHFKHPKHGPFPVAITASPIVRDRQIIGAIETFRDITKEKEVDRMKTEFISIVSHELRTPLTVIREGVCLVLEKLLGPTTPKQEQFLNLALHDIDRLSRIINDLLDVSRIEAGKVELKRRHVLLPEIVKGVARTFESRMKARKIEFRLYFPEHASQIYVDPDKMTQVFTNLIGNACKFTESGFIEIGIEETSHEAVCYVRDTGCGISGQDMNRVFGKFQQFGQQQKNSPEKGTGLGLSIARAIVELHQGRIWVESEEGKGTCFWFRIPFMTPEELYSQHVSQEISDAYKRGKVLTLFSLKLHSDIAARIENSGQRSDVLDTLIRQVLIETPSFFPGPFLHRRDGADFMILGLDFHHVQAFKDKFMAELEKFLKAKPSAEDVLLKSVSFPDDGSTEEELYDHLKAA